MFLSFLGRPTRPLFLPFLTYSRVGVGVGVGAGVGASGFSFTCSPSDSPSEYESAEFPDMTGEGGRKGKERKMRASVRNLDTYLKHKHSQKRFVDTVLDNQTTHKSHSPSSSRQMWFRLIPLNNTPSLSPHSTTRPTLPIRPGSCPIPAQFCVTWYSLSRKCSNLSTALPPGCPGSSPSPRSSSCVRIATWRRTLVWVRARGLRVPLERARLRRRSVPRSGVAGEW